MGNYSYTGLGCDRTTGPWGTGYAGDYAPANTAMFNSVETYASTVFWRHLWLYKCDHFTTTGSGQT